MIGKTIDEMNVGDAAEMAKTVTETDVYLFAGITGDFNPAHVNEAYAKNTFFKGRIAHGMLSAGFISAVLAMKLPGPGTIYLLTDLDTYDKVLRLTTRPLYPLARNSRTILLCNKENNP